MNPRFFNIEIEQLLYLEFLALLFNPSHLSNLRLLKRVHRPLDFGQLGVAGRQGGRARGLKVGEERADVVDLRKSRSVGLILSH